VAPPSFALNAKSAVALALGSDGAESIVVAGTLRSIVTVTTS